jgi:hypothetical protein
MIRSLAAIGASAVVTVAAVAVATHQAPGSMGADAGSPMSTGGTVAEFVTPTTSPVIRATRGITPAAVPPKNRVFRDRSLARSKGANMACPSTTWVAPGADGRLEVFAVGSDHGGGQSLWHRWQTTSVNGWSDWFSLGAPPDANGLRWSPTVAPGADGYLEVFVVGDDLQPDGLGSGGALHRSSQTVRNGGLSHWRSYPTGGPNLFGSPAVVRGTDGHLEVFVLGDDGALWHMWQTLPIIGWSQWVSHGAPRGLLLNSAPSVIAGEDGRLDVFIVSQEAALWRIAKTAADGGWSDWVSHGSPSGVLFGSDSTPVVARSADGHLELFVVGNDGRLWQMRQTVANGGWSGWRPHDGPSGMKFLRLRPAVASGLDGRLDLFLVGDDASLWHLRQKGSNDGSSQWFSHGGPAEAGLAGSPAVAADADGEMQVFVMGTDGALWQLSQTGPSSGWSQWSSHGAPPGTSLLAAITTG